MTTTAFSQHRCGASGVHGSVRHTSFLLQIVSKRLNHSQIQLNLPQFRQSFHVKSSRDT